MQDTPCPIEHPVAVPAIPALAIPDTFSPNGAAK